MARATANNDLGIAAKVAPDNGEDQRPRLICIYTKDFSDRGDITRVVQKLKDLGLVETRGSKIYYKCGMYSCSSSASLGKLTGPQMHIPFSVWAPRTNTRSKRLSTTLGISWAPRNRTRKARQVDISTRRKIMETGNLWSTNDCFNDTHFAILQWRFDVAGGMLFLKYTHLPNDLSTYF